MTDCKPLEMELPAVRMLGAGAVPPRIFPGATDRKKDAEVAPVVFYQPVKAKVKICQCGKSDAPPYCDGSHGGHVVIPENGCGKKHSAL